MACHIDHRDSPGQWLGCEIQCPLMDDWWLLQYNEVARDTYHSLLIIDVLDQQFLHNFIHSRIMHQYKGCPQRLPSVATIEIVLIGKLNL